MYDVSISTFPTLQRAEVEERYGLFILISYFQGEIKNKASSYVDHSIIYGATIEESNKVRSFSRGKIRLTPGEIFPIDSNGKFTAISIRLGISISLAFWGTFFLRNHNKLAERLACLNPSWSDEKLYQEARRINIAVLQNLISSKEYLKTLIGKQSTKFAYNEKVETSCTVEFMQAAARFTHFFVRENMSLLYVNGSTKEIPTSDTTGRSDILEASFEDSVRGALNQKLSLNQYSEEVSDSIEKTLKPIDLQSFL